MTRLLCNLAVLAGLLGGLTGCSQVSGRPDDGQLALGAADSDRTVHCKPGGVVQITLDSNVTTGYSWKLVPLEARAVEQTSQEYIAPKTPAAGAGGKEIWKFTARAAGQAVIRLQYVRPWETNVPPARTFQVTVIVK